MTRRTRDDAKPVGGVRRAVDSSLVVGTVLTVITTVLYLLSPIDAVPDLVPIAGQLDDAVAVLLGGGTVGFMTLLRLFVGVGIRDRRTRRACFLVLLMVMLPVLACIGCIGGAAVLVLANPG
jgi:hypothetical protein